MSFSDLPQAKPVLVVAGLAGICERFYTSQGPSWLGCAKGDPRVLRGSDEGPLTKSSKDSLIILQPVPQPTRTNIHTITNKYTNAQAHTNTHTHKHTHTNIHIHTHTRCVGLGPWGPEKLEIYGPITRLNSPELFFYFSGPENSYFLEFLLIFLLFGGRGIGTKFGLTDGIREIIEQGPAGLVSRVEELFGSNIELLGSIIELFGSRFLRARGLEQNVSMM